MPDDLERQLHLERARLEAVLRQMPSGVLIVEAPSGKIVLANEQLTRISGRTTRLGETLEEYRDWPTFHPDGRLYQVEEWPLVRSMINGETVIDEEMGFIRGDGRRAVMRASSAPIRDADGRIVAAVVTVQDITGRKQARRAAGLRGAASAVVRAQPGRRLPFHRAGLVAGLQRLIRPHPGLRRSGNDT